MTNLILGVSDSFNNERNSFHTMSVKQPLVCALVILFTSVDKLYIWEALLVLVLFDEYNFISQMQEM
jgi:hypothetical protein